MLGLNRDYRATSNVGGREATDTARRVHNLIRYGVVAEADYEKALVRVSLQEGELLTDWIPWWTLRAGKDRFWWAPEVDEVVLLLSPSGELATGLVMPAGFSNQNQPADRETVQRTVYDDGTIVEYDREAHKLLVDATESSGDVVVKSANVIVECSEEVKVNAPIINLNPG